MDFMVQMDEVDVLMSSLEFGADPVYRWNNSALEILVREPYPADPTLI